MDEKERVLILKACVRAAKVISPQTSDALAEDILWDRLLGLGIRHDSAQVKKALDDLFKGLEGHSLAWRICHLAETVKTMSPSEEKRVGRRPDPELKALAATLPRRPGYVSFVRDRKYLATHKRIMKEQGMVVYTRPDKSGGMLFPMFCAFQSLKFHRKMDGLTPQWFIPPGKGIALLQVVPTEYREMPLGSFCEAENIKDEVLLRDFYKECEPNPTHVPPMPSKKLRPRLSEIMKSKEFQERLADSVKDWPKAKQNIYVPQLSAESLELPTKEDAFPFEVGDWVYVPLNAGELQVKAQIQLTNYDFEPSCCVVRLEAFVAEDATGKKFMTPSQDMALRKSFITQRAFPPIPYSSKREIGTSDVPGGYLNLDWE